MAISQKHKYIIMKKNMGTLDRLIRLVIALVLVIVYMNHMISGTLGIVALVIAGVFTLTSLVSFCPLYTLIGLNTCKTK